MNDARICPVCQRTYASHERFCMADGSPLCEPIAALQTAQLPRFAAAGLRPWGETTDRVHRDEAATVPFDRHREGSFDRKETEILNAVAGRPGEYLRSQLNEGWLELQEVWLRLSGLLLSTSAPDLGAIARERARLDELLDEYQEDAEQLLRLK